LYLLPGGDGFSLREGAVMEEQKEKGRTIIIVLDVECYV